MATLSTFIATAVAVLLALFCTVEAQVTTSCPPLPGTYVKLLKQPYALCAGAAAVNYDFITYAKCKRMRGTSISEQQRYPFPDNPTFNVIPRTGDIATVNAGRAVDKGYMVSTYSPPAGLSSPRNELALNTCSDGGSYAQCDGGLCFTSTTGKSSPLWGKVSDNEIICSCPVTTTSDSFQVFGSGQCPTTRAAFDAVCGRNVTAANNGAVLYIGSPTGVPEALAACLNQTAVFNHCERPLT